MILSFLAEPVDKHGISFIPEGVDLAYLMTGISRELGISERPK